MTLYVDSSALLKRYLEEPGSGATDRLMLDDPRWVTARHTFVEVTRILARQLRGGALDSARGRFNRDWALTRVVELSEAVCTRAAEIAVANGVRTLDALHLGAAHSAGGEHLPFLTYDVRQAEVARSLGWAVFGA